MDLSIFVDFCRRQPWIYVAFSAMVGFLIALVAHRMSGFVLLRVTRHHPMTAVLLHHAYTPSRWVLVALILQLVWEGAPDDLRGMVGTREISRLALIAAVTWLVARCCAAIGEGVIRLHPLDGVDNLGARRIHTQTRVLVRCVSLIVLLVGLAAMLMTFPAARQIGTSLMASAGLVGLVAGFAARPVLGNLIAGLQIAITQPIRLDDVLIVQGEWGRVEEITGAYVVVRIWDERRLVVPLQWFIENPFQNWTRSSSRLIGTVFLWADYRLPLEPLRQELKRLCSTAAEWDQRVCVLQVTDTNERAMQLRVLVSAPDSSKAWDLRCKVREGLIAFIQCHQPDCLPRVRAELTRPGHDEPHLDLVARGFSSVRPE
jgi:small-conductance mechanosensitive channel